MIIYSIKKSLNVYQKRMQFVMIMMFSCAAMWKQGERDMKKLEQDAKCLCLKMPESLKDKFPFMNMTVLVSLTMLWLYMFTYGMFFLQVNITDNVQISGGISPIEAVKLITAMQSVHCNINIACY